MTGFEQRTSWYWQQPLCQLSHNQEMIIFVELFQIKRECIKNSNALGLSMGEISNLSVDRSNKTLS